MVSAHAISLIVSSLWDSNFTKIHLETSAPSSLHMLSRYPSCDAVHSQDLECGPMEFKTANWTARTFLEKNNGHSLSLTLLKFKTSWDYYGSIHMNYNLIAEERINRLEALLFFNSWVSLPYLDTSVQSPQVTINSNTPEEYHDLI